MLPNRPIAPRLSKDEKQSACCAVIVLLFVAGLPECHEISSILFKIHVKL